MGTGSFVHLHTHSEFSLLDGASRISELFAKASELGMPALGLTDHGVMFGALDFYRAARQAGVKPILGVEAYVAPGRRFDRTPGEDEEKYRHLTVLARNERGYRNLLRLVTDAHLEGFYHRPRIDKELLAERSEGLVGFTGCLAGEVCRLLLAGQDRKAYAAAATYRDIFGPGSFFVELQDHGLAEQRAVNPKLVKLARDLGIPLVATNDTHYTEKGHARAHDVLLCIQQPGKVLADTDRLKFDTEEFFVKSAQEMRELFRDLPEACDATLEIAESVELLPDLERALVEANPEMRVPNFDPPDGKDLDTYLHELVEEGARRRYGDLTPEIRERLEHELRVIRSKGFSGYFLIVWDLIRFARGQGIRVGPGRGSAAGSVVSYCLGITDLDPLRYGLIFERFLNPERKQMPDIDMDFDDRRRPEVIRYVAERYGTDRVAQIITFSTIKAKQAIRDAARVLGYPYAVGDKLTKMYPPLILGKEATFEACFDRNVEWPPHSGRNDAYAAAAELRRAYEEDEINRRVIDSARKLEGLRRQHSVHAAGVVIGNEPLVHYLPVQKTSVDGEVVTQYEMRAVEQLGLLKMDFLGLRNLDVIDKAVGLVGGIDITKIPLDDRPTYEMLARGDAMGVFQFESSGMREALRQVRPTEFEDLIALVALYRPGPMAYIPVYAKRKHGQEQVTFLDERLRPITEPTLGLCIYQEQYMEIAKQLAGFSPAEADDLRKAIGKKIHSLMASLKDKFLEGCAANGVTHAVANQLWKDMEQAQDYSFNKSHAACYGLIAYRTAYLKANWPAEYMAALISSVMNTKDKVPF
ncbi:MAG: DNA polymerase III subunit alpha, partial [Actinomycetota bacterium]